MQQRHRTDHSNSITRRASLGRARRDGKVDVGAEDRSDRAAPVEDGRGLGCDEAECASNIALGCGDDDE